MSGAAKLDYLKRYVTKKTKTEKKGSNQLKIIDRELEVFDKRDSEDEEDEKPLFIDSAESTGLSRGDKENLLKLGQFGAMKINTKTNALNKARSGMWSTVDPNKSTEIPSKKEKADESSDSSDEEPARGNGKRRHDSDSEDDENGNNQINGEERAAKKEQEKMDRMKADMRRALGIQGEEPEPSREVKVDEGGDLSPLRENLPQVDNYGKKSILEIKLNNKKAKEAEEKIRVKAEEFKNAQTIYRDKQGNKIDIVQDLESKKQELIKKNEKRISEWGSGVVQKKEGENRRKEIQAMRQENFAQYELGKQQDINMMELARFGDPMSRLIATNEKKEEGAPKQKSTPRLKCKFPGIPNRFGIAPGHRWDGVDRSNGHERKVTHSSNTNKEREDTANQWSMREL